MWYLQALGAVGKYTECIIKGPALQYGKYIYFVSVRNLHVAQPFPRVDAERGLQIGRMN